MDPFLYTLFLILAVITTLFVLLYSTNWSLIDARKKAAFWEQSYREACNLQQGWERKCRDAWERNTQPPTWMEPSGYDIQVGEYRVPLYKPFGVFDFIRSEELTEYCILEGNKIVERNPLASKLAVMNGDRLYLYVEVRNVCRSGGESPSSSSDVPL